MNNFHKTYLVIIAICGLPFAGLGLLLAIPATIDLSPAAFILLIPAMLVFWDFILLFRNNKIRRLKVYLIAFYIITGCISVLASFMKYHRDGTSGFIFNPLIAVPVAIFFIVPIIALIIKKQEKSTERKDLGDSVPPPQI